MCKRARADVHYQNLNDALTWRSARLLVDLDRLTSTSLRNKNVYCSCPGRKRRKVEVRIDVKLEAYSALTMPIPAGLHIFMALQVGGILCCRRFYSLPLGPEI
jgi:hypothetical protein